MLFSELKKKIKSHNLTENDYDKVLSNDIIYKNNLDFKKIIINNINIFIFLVKEKEYEEILKLPSWYVRKINYLDKTMLDLFFLLLRNLKSEEFEIILKIYLKFEGICDLKNKNIITSSLFSLVLRIEENEIYYKLLDFLSLFFILKQNDKRNLTLNDYCILQQKKVLKIKSNKTNIGNITKFLNNKERKITKQIEFSKKIEKFNLNNFNKEN